jgi:hypothetical protein
MSPGCFATSQRQWPKPPCSLMGEQRVLFFSRFPTAPYIGEPRTVRCSLHLAGRLFSVPPQHYRHSPEASNPCLGG